MPMVIPEPSDDAPLVIEGAGTLHRYEQCVAALTLLAQEPITSDMGSRMLALIKAYDVLPFNLEHCSRCHRIGLPCDYCHDPRNDGSEMWSLCWEVEEDEN